MELIKYNLKAARDFFTRINEKYSLEKRTWKILLWVAIFGIYYIDSITAWSNYGLRLSVISVSACMVSVELSTWYAKKFIFSRLEQADFNLTNSRIWQLSRYILGFSIIGSIVGYALSWLWNFDNPDLSALYITTHNSLLSSIKSTNGHIEKLNHIASWVRTICGEDGDENVKWTSITLSFIRNIPEALTTTAAFLFWEAAIWLNRQEQKIRKMELSKNLLSNRSNIHEFMNFQNLLTLELEKFEEENLEITKNKEILSGILDTQRAITNFQRFRHSLINDNDNESFLKNELEAIRNLIDIIKHMNKTEFEVDLPFDNQFDENIRVSSQIFIELLWNAYKYSQYKEDTESPKPYIVIELAVNEQDIYFYILNNIGDKPNDKSSTRTGLETIKTGLDLHYGEKKYSFTKTKTVNNEYKVELRIPIKFKKNDYAIHNN